MCPGPKSIEDAAKIVKERLAKESQNTQFRTLEQRVASLEKVIKEMQEKMVVLDQMAIQIKAEMDDTIGALAKQLSELQESVDSFYKGLALVVGTKVSVVETPNPEEGIP